MKFTLFCGGPGAKQSTQLGQLTTAFCIIKDGVPLQIDLGSGTHLCSEYLAAEGIPKGPVQTLMTHSHWDHTLGDQDFQPFFNRGTHIVHVPLLSEAVGEVVGTYFKHLFHPVRWPIGPQTFGGGFDLCYFTVGNEVETAIGLVKTIQLPHPQGIAVLRIDRLVFATDIEIAAREDQEKFAAFCEGCDTLVVDLQWRDEEREGLPCPASSLAQIKRAGWGHSTPSMVAKALAMMQQPPRKLIVTHHDPDRTSADFFAFQGEVKKALSPWCSRVVFAQQGHEYEIGE